MIKVAIAGLGFMGKMHLGVYLNLANAEVAALCDATADSLDIKSLDSGGNIETASRKVNLDSVKKYVDYDEMLRKGGFDVVDVCLPTYLHTEYVLKALDAGYHVFCEKPMAGSIEETVKILKKIEETKKLFGVGQCLRYWPAYAEIKKIVDEMKYGKVRYAEFARFSMRPDWSWKSWLTDSKRSGNAALDLHIHDVDMILCCDFNGRMDLHKIVRIQHESLLDTGKGNNRARFFQGNRGYSFSRRWRILSPPFAGRRRLLL
jgi:predicted dehydrogenase